MVNIAPKISTTILVCMMFFGISVGQGNWMRIYESKYSESAVSVLPAENQGHVIFGTARHSTLGLGDCVYLIKVAASGDSLW
jgi:hypothetical protein